MDHFRCWRTVGHEQDSRTPSQQQRRDEVQHAGLGSFQEVLTEDMSPFNPLAPLRPQTNTKAGGRQHTSALTQPPSCTAVMRAAQVVETDSLEARGRRETAQVSCATRYKKKPGPETRTLERSRHHSACCTTHCPRATEVEEAMLSRQLPRRVGGNRSVSAC